MENVQGVLTDIDSWNSWLESLTQLGYTNYWKKVNAKDYGIPQNRIRVFMVSVLGDYSYVFPKKVQLKYRLINFLQKNVDEKFFLSDEAIKRITNWKYHENPIKRLLDGESITPTITTRVAESQDGGISGSTKLVKVCNYGNGQSVAIKNATKQGYLLAENGDGVDCSGRMKTHRGTVQKGLSQTLTTSADIGVVVNETTNINTAKKTSKRLKN